ncbi:hypothetical protein SAMN02745975_01245 [Geosporobacter subterraneus DSM 17957]|uniref:Uncharacterized protein n=1 Tax=Geosporobacter subterraneus DSM 17957 TaxID=1121919 RepID=A0A1M6GF32_9FIRM|nr:hypothetical protein SAMN02745975_01245 [Geosporobacter subterraneus DSM 17957]
MNMNLENIMIISSTFIIFSVLGYLNYKSTMNKVKRLQEKMGILNKKLTGTKHF